MYIFYLYLYNMHIIYSYILYIFVSIVQTIDEIYYHYINHQCTVIIPLSLLQPHQTIPMYRI